MIVMLLIILITDKGGFNWGIADDIKYTRLSLKGFYVNMYQ